MSLHQTLKEFLALLRSNPAASSDPRVLDHFEKLADDDRSSAGVAMMAPRAELTFEVPVDLLKADPQSQEIALEFPRAVDVIAFVPIIVPKVFPLPIADVFPTLDDLYIRIDVEDERRFTNGNNQANTASEFVTASTMSILLPRIVDRCLDYAKPRLSIQWMWKQGPGIFTDSICTLTALANYKDGGDRRRP